MSKLNSSVKNSFTSFKNAVPLVLKGVIAFLLITSGLFTGLIFRYLDYNAGIIIFTSLVLEFIALLIVYLFFRNYLKSDENSEENKAKKKP